MFVLRVVDVDGVEINKSLGDSYNLIEQHAEKDFKRCMDNIYPSGKPDKETYAFLVYNSGGIVRPLYSTQWNYIMTASGKTFANVTHVDRR